MPERCTSCSGPRARVAPRPRFLAYYQRVRERFAARSRRGSTRTRAVVLRPLRFPSGARPVAEDDHLEPRGGAARPDPARSPGVATARSRARGRQRPPARWRRDVREAPGPGCATAPPRDGRAPCRSFSSGARVRRLPPPGPATSSSTSRATRSGTPNAGSSTSSASPSPRRRATFTALWAHDRAERAEDVRGVRRPRPRAPAQAPRSARLPLRSYEPTGAEAARLDLRHARVEELDELLRREIFVDLLQRRPAGAAISHPRYGLKNVEQFFFQRKADLRAGDDSIVLYERWRLDGDQTILDDIRGVQRGGLRRPGCSASGSREGRAGTDGARRSSGATHPRERASRRRRPSSYEERDDLRALLLERGETLAGATYSTTTGARRSRPGGRSSTGSGGPARNFRNVTKGDRRARAAGSPIGSASGCHQFRFPVQQHQLGPGARPSIRNRRLRWQHRRARR